MSEAAAQLPGERHMKLWLSAVYFFHFCGTVHENSCCPHWAVCPPAMAACCSAVGLGASASSPAPVEVEPPLSPLSASTLRTLAVSCALRLTYQARPPAATVSSSPPPTTSTRTTIRTLTPVDMPFF